MYWIQHAYASICRIVQHPTPPYFGQKFKIFYLLFSRLESVASINTINLFCRLILKNKHFRTFFVFDQYFKINALHQYHTYTAWIRFLSSLCQVLRAEYSFRAKLTFLIQQRPMTKYRHLKERNLEERFGSQVSIF